MPRNSALTVSASIKRKTTCIWMSGRVKREYGKEGSSLDIEYMLKLIANNGFPLVLSIYLVWKLESFINEIIQNQKEFSRNVTIEIKEIKKTISDLRVDFAKNQWKRWWRRILTIFKVNLSFGTYLLYFYIWQIITVTQKYIKQGDGYSFDDPLLSLVL